MTNLMVIEGRDIITLQQVPIPRCISCFNKLSKGYCAGLKSDCGHTICFKCSLQDDFTECPLDRRPFTKFEHINIPENLLIPECHSGHSLFNYKNNVYKLPCFHYSCEECSSADICVQCSTEIHNNIKNKNSRSSLRKADRIMDLIEFCKISDDETQLHAYFFNTKQQPHSESLPEINSDNNLIDQQKETWPDLFDGSSVALYTSSDQYVMEFKALANDFKNKIKRLEQSNVKDLNFIKQTHYFNLLTNQEKMNLYNKGLMYLNELNVQLKESSEIKRFGKCLPGKIFIIKKT